jgi:hypothetical protein
MSETKNLDNDPRFNFGPPLIQTPEDATMAYLREAITEDEYKAACGKFGVMPGQIVTKQNPIDAAFVRKIPDELREPEVKEPTVEERIKTANEAQAERDKASKEAEKDNKTTPAPQPELAKK